LNHKIARIKNKADQEMKSLLLNYIYDPSNKENNKRGKEQEIKE